ncbi:hypothetical protein L3Q82_019887 [Scortum barcoo]|uniref:Uncharacterized protein n=1 Tax=Scortum barcoo TaxID=214431 RepID=A0ACB8VCE2_9TELE|nr:hypothetical protein L3Q82_019887 [Scortum barcoo]
MFEHKGVHQCTWHQDTLGRRSMIDFVVVSSDLRPYVLDTRVKRGAELSTDHHLVIDRYRQAKQAAAQEAVLEAKTRVWEEFGEAMEEDYRSASKRFWQTVRRLRRGKQYSATVYTVYSAGGELLTSGTGDIVRTLPSSGRRYGVDEIRPEYLKSLDVVGLSWLTHAFATLHGGWGQCLWCGKLGWWSLFLKRGPESVFQLQGDHTSQPPREGLRQGTGEEKPIRPIVDPRIQEEQCGFRPWSWNTGPALYPPQGA